MNHLVVVNPRAGKRRGASINDAVAAAFQRHGLSFEIAVTEGPGHARVLVAERGPGFDAVVVVGGDGTLHEALQSLDLDRHRLGVVPLGTGNDFAWMNGWPGDLDACTDRIAARAVRRLDLGTWKGTTSQGVREARFHNSIGLGFEALVNRESARMKGRWGAFTYVLAVLRSLPRYRRFHVETTWTGASPPSGSGEQESGYAGAVTLLDVCIGKRVGGCFLIAPHADASDGRLDLILADGMSLARALLLLPRIFDGSHLRSAAVHRHLAADVRMVFPGGIPMYVDGEFVDEEVRDLEVRTLAGKLLTF